MRKPLQLFVSALLGVALAGLPALPADAYVPRLCNDGIDNDADGRTDYPSDPGCTSATDPTERGSVTCDNGEDDDRDSLGDYPADPGCSGPSDSTEWTGAGCDDGLDNDGDGWTDFPRDQGCESAADNTEGPGCTESAPGVVVCVTPTGVWTEDELFAVAIDPGPQHPLKGYVDTYRFTVNGVGQVDLPCVVLLVDTTPVSPCASVGTFVERRFYLLDSRVEEQLPVQGDFLARARVCTADYRATVLGFGLTRFPAYVLC